MDIHIDLDIDVEKSTDRFKTKNDSPLVCLCMKTYEHYVCKQPEIKEAEKQRSRKAKEQSGARNQESRKNLSLQMEEHHSQNKNPPSENSHAKPITSHNWVQPLAMY